MKSTSKRVLLILAISLIVVGAVMGALWGTIFDNILKSQLELTNDSTTFKLWKETPIPMYIEFYMYNVTNSEEVRNNKAKPILIELGPYVFSEEHSKTNITWNKNQSITFNQVRRWHYLPDKSIGSLDDKITNLNTMSLRNNSWSYDGVFNMFTGTGQVEHLGKMHSWNYYTRVPYYDGHCADVNGTAGELWPPNETGNEVTMFVSDLCRSITLNYEEEQSVFGVVGRKFIGRRSVVANATDNADNKCFTRGKIYPSGVFDVSGCKFGAPAYMSFPNFYLADPFYLDNVVGLKPEKDKHEFQITLEPRTGIPLSVSGRLQLNLHLQPVKGITMYESVPDVFMPMLWFTERAAVTPDLADEVKLLLIVPTAGQGIFFGLLGLGVFLVLVHVLMTLRGNWKAGEANAQLVVTS
ncbi:protein peste-like isoform X2 [Ischnura elegans]|uniref:protein peste-like isoform X2 n=1 Tax=Ischnura elegans TaxID=197161 RepID=UPI001ED8B15B|nr:protein peste-like isoform X2 [Ischnura elegans]